MTSNKDKTRFQYLLRSYMAGKLHDDEQLELDRYMHHLPVTVVEKWSEPVLKEILSANDLYDTIDPTIKEKVYRRIEERVKQGRIRKSTRLFRYNYVAVAATILLLGMVALIVGRYQRTQTQQREIAMSVSDTTATDIFLHDESAAQLRLPNGEVYMMSDATISSQISAVHGIRIDQRGDGQFTYTVDPSMVSDPQFADQYFTFKSPKGKSVEIVLSDGTTVHLNSESSLRYPLNFQAQQRQVYLDGEAFFDVSHDQNKPFLVQAGGQSVKVLGTTFNISAYHDDALLTTTLISGSILLSRGDQTLLLVPGEQAVLNLSSNELIRSRVDVRDIILWQDGYFYFSNNTLGEILTKVSRWYDVEKVDIQGYQNLRFSGTFKRSKSLQELFTKLKKIENFNVDIKGRRVMIY